MNGSHFFLNLSEFQRNFPSKYPNFFTRFFSQNSPNFHKFSSNFHGIFPQIFRPPRCPLSSVSPPPPSPAPFSALSPPPLAVWPSPPHALSPPLSPPAVGVLPLVCPTPPPTWRNIPSRRRRSPEFSKFLRNFHVFSQRSVGKFRKIGRQKSFSKIECGTLRD